jgi:hypothetical protein
MAIKLNILRGTIIRLLKEVYPDGLNETEVVGIYYQYYKPDDIRASLQYLTDKGYLSRLESPHPYKPLEKIVGYKLLPKGIDLIDGNVDADPGITLSPEA